MPAKNLVRPEIQALRAYQVPPSDGLIKLDAMENPYPWPGELRDAWLQSLQDVALNRYPSASGERLKNRLRQTFGLPAEAPLLLGNGSDELIQLVAMALAAPGQCGEPPVLLAPHPSFAVYQMVATFTGMRYVGVALRDDFSLDLEAMLAAIAEHHPKLIFIAYPNNPTGNRFAAAEVEQLIAAAPGVVVIDEAYYAFSEHSFLDKTKDYQDVLVMRTASKIGLAGLRLGFLSGPPDWISELEKLRLPYNINTLTQLSVDFALSHHEQLLAQARRIKLDRDALARSLATLPGVAVYPSETNFILARFARSDIEKLFATLRDGGVLVKNLHGQGGSLSGCLRISIGDESENQRLFELLQHALQSTN